MPDKRPHRPFSQLRHMDCRIAKRATHGAYSGRNRRPYGQDPCTHALTGAYSRSIARKGSMSAIQDRLLLRAIQDRQFLPNSSHSPKRHTQARTALLRDHGMIPPNCRTTRHTRRTASHLSTHEWNCTQFHALIDKERARAEAPAQSIIAPIDPCTVQSTRPFPYR